MNSLISCFSLLKPLPASFYVQVFSRVQAARVGRIRESKKFIQHPNRDRRLPVYMLETVEEHGLKGEIVWVNPTIVRQVLLPEKLAIPARIYDPYLRGQRHMVLEANRLGALGDSLQTPEIRLAKAILLVRKVLESGALCYTPDSNKFVIFPEDVSVCYREELELNIPRECIGCLEEEGISWPITRVGEYSYNVRIDPEVTQLSKLTVLEPVVVVDPKATKYD